MLMCRASAMLRCSRQLGGDDTDVEGGRGRHASKCTRPPGDRNAGPARVSIEGRDLPPISAGRAVYTGEMSSTVSTSRPPATFNRLAWSNLAAQSAEQIGLAAAPIIAVLVLGAGPGETGVLQAVQMLPFLLLSLP